MSKSEGTSGAHGPTSLAVEQADAAIQLAGERDADLAPGPRIPGDAPVLRAIAPRLGISFVVSVVLAMVVGGVVGFIRGPVGPWRIQYFDNKDFEGKAKVQHSRKVEFDWEKGSPMRGIGKDGWSALLDTCIDVEEETEVVFRLSSDDGGRLYVDGEMLIDNWGAHATRTRTGKTTLTKGVHHLRVEYFEATATANLKLLAGFDGEKAETIPPDLLTQPPKSGDNPCE